MKVLNGKISGGYSFKKFKGLPSPKLVVPELPGHLSVPLTAFDTGVKPLVRSGDNVRAGQIICQDDESISSPVHSPVNGVVDSVKKMDYLGTQINVVKIESGKSDSWETVPGYSKKWSELKKTELEKVIYLSGTSSLGKGGIPTSYNSSVIEPSEVRHILIKAVDAELYNPDISLFLQDEGAAHFSEGLSILFKIMDQADFRIVIGSNSSNWFQVLDNSLADDLPVTYHRVKPLYPQNNDLVLLKTVLDMDLPSGYTGINKGVVVLSIQDVCHIYDAVVHGKPLIERVIALGGTGFTDRPHLLLKIGTAVSDIVDGKLSSDDEGDIRFINNSVLSGETLDLKSPIGSKSEVLIALKEQRSQELMFFAKPGFKKDSFSNTFLAKFIPIQKNTSTNLNGEQRACLSCGFCQSVCPSEILPNVLFPYVERDRLDETAVQYGIFKCIDCNLCTYVCPSKIPIAAYLKEGKKKLLEDAYVKEDDFISFYNLIGVKELTNEATE
jgi:Na+-translocating ferredoxin:NAD+ oxidoreductase subunit C